MAINEILGWAKLILDTFGLTPFLVAAGVISTAAAVFSYFVRRGD
jgi:hypothetical protein